MSATKKLWVGLGILLAASFAVLLWVGTEIHRVMPPIPEAVVTTQGDVVYTRSDIETGRQVWQSIGGHQLGSIWGHGSYVAPDWTADWLHKEAVAWLDIRSRAVAGVDYADLEVGLQAAEAARLKPVIRENTFDEAAGVITIAPERAEAIAVVTDHYVRLFTDDPDFEELRKAYAMKNGTIADPEHARQLTAFVWWTAWSAVTERPGQAISYTANWPHDPLVGNTPAANLMLWSVFSVLFLIAGIGLLGWWYATQREESPDTLPAIDPLSQIKVTPSMRATAKYFWVVMALFLLQILLGALTAHYQVEGHDFYGIALSEILPYSLTRSWHTQLAILWIATAWLGMGLYIGPAISGIEPKFQRLGVNALWVCLIIIVVGAFTGQWFAVMQKMGLEHNFWFGHQGWEYVDIGRFWQWFLFIGLGLWLFLVGRTLVPAIRMGGEHKSITALLFLSTVAIGLFYGAGLMYGEHTHLSMVEYWRWWVVHLWVEGFFEVFATAVIAFLFTKLGLLRASTATVAVLFATIVFMAGGVLGTLHHLYFTGTPTAVIAIGASFSALEVVPLAFIGAEAYHTWRHAGATPWMARYKWPILFFVAVAFWNLVGAGLFGFLINPPLPLYYMQGLNLTPLHGHTALFGVYGFLGIGLMLFCLRGIKPHVVWNEKLLSTAFWALNIGLVGMAVMTLLPMGIIQLVNAIEHGYWYARSEHLMQSPLIQMLVWMRVPGDTIFSVGAVTLAWFVMRLWIAPKSIQAPVEGGATEQA
ncbi:nitric-oxide reductase large subunit [Alkalisalibacterium limincola]|uniref:Nitric-oxide reductase large subunit n=1 Tax=Alkalisalibacterium limincola TaxID=2699169 RepID=A0A5C8KKJ9_9GAMM|nr:nitric-oxide reductase large subunit [Alkalisalibacterium limincola]TXK59812.1 nitric-oxide reductase large subunit [Alkalisalibacterium limincola]